MPKFEPKPKIEEVTRAFGKAHREKASAEARMAKFRKIFFDLITIPKSELAQQTIYYEGDNPQQHVATLYPKWKLITYSLLDDKAVGEYEWKLLIQEDPEKKSYIYINPLDKMVYSRTVAESAPGIDMERLKSEDVHLWSKVTFQPPLPERELKPLSELDDEQKDGLKKFLTPVTLQNRMDKPRKAKPDELEGI